jgi:hypothetical protein
MEAMTCTRYSITGAGIRPGGFQAELALPHGRSHENPFCSNYKLLSVLTSVIPKS